MRGFVVELGDRDPAKLKPIAGVSGDRPVFDARLRDSLVWAAHHYVAPVAVTMERAAPPNLPGLTEPAAPTAPEVTSNPPGTPLGELVSAVNAGRRRPVTALLSPWGETSWLDAIQTVAGGEQSVLVVAATSAEVVMVADRARQTAGDGLVIDVTGELADAELTQRWVESASVPGHIVVGTPRIASWPIAGLALAVVLEEGRRAMKDRQTPTIAVRRLIMTRARLEGFSQLYVGPTPSLELLAAGAEILRTGHRAWPLVEVMDRNEEAPGSGLVSSRARAAISSTADKGGRTFVFTHRRGYAPAYRCSNCRELRRCSRCGSRPEPGEACPRCGAPSQPCSSCGGRSFEPLGAGVGRVLAEMRGIFGDRVGDPDSESPIVVGTERDLASVPGVDLAVAVDVDGLVLGSHFRAAEDALRVLARLAGRVRRGSGHRLIVQTSMPDHPLVAALRRGDPIEFLEQEMDLRRSKGYPPSTEMMVVEVRGDASAVDADLHELADQAVTVMGPAATHDARRWLIQGPGLGGFKLGLRPLVQRWRDGGSTVRIDVDPLDL